MEKTPLMPCFEGNTGRIKILLIEDDEDHIELTLNTLKKSNLLEEIYVVKDGEEAIDFLYKKRNHTNAPTPQLILLDLKLPKISGYEVLLTIKKDNNLKIIPVIVLTSSVLEQDMKKTYLAGVNSYIVKPVQYKNFVEKISQIPFYWISVNASLGAK